MSLESQFAATFVGNFGEQFVGGHRRERFGVVGDRRGRIALLHQRRQMFGGGFRFTEPCGSLGCNQIHLCRAERTARIAASTFLKRAHRSRHLLEILAFALVARLVGRDKVIRRSSDVFVNRRHHLFERENIFYRLVIVGQKRRLLRKVFEVGTLSNDALCRCASRLPIAFVEGDTCAKSPCSDGRETIVETVVPFFDFEPFVGFVEVGNHLLIDRFHAAAIRNGLDVGCRLHGNSACRSRRAGRVGLGVEVHEQEVHIGAKGVCLANELADFVGGAIGDFVLMLDDVVCDVDGVVVATPTKRGRRGLRCKVVPRPNVEEGIVVLGGGRSPVERHFVGSKRSNSSVFGHRFILVGEQCAIFVGSLGNDFSRRCDVEEIIARCGDNRQ